MDSASDRDGRSPLHYAANDGDAQLVRHLLAQGYNASHADHRGWTPLHFAAQAASTEVMIALLDAGAEVDGRDEHGNTPLLNAVFNSRGHGDAIELLRARGANPYAQNAHGQTPLGLARLIANYDVARYFSDLP